MQSISVVAIRRSVSLMGASRWLCRLTPLDVRLVKSHSSSSLLGRLLALVW